MDIDLNKKKINRDKKEQFEKLFCLLSEYNKRYNLTSITDMEGVYCKHFLDSVVGEKYFPCGASVVEVGSGGGFPSLPLKILRDDLFFTLIESTGKKCEYLKAASAALGLDGVKVLNIRAEEGARDEKMREKFDACTARAVARMNTLCEYCLPFVKTGGVFIAYKGDVDEELKEAEKAIKILGGRVETVDKFEINGEKRAIVVIKKIAPTPEKYPRGRGLERKKPIA